ncbi:hypothetical protein COOONC_23028, partial [Cooperia oncophora]
MRANHESHWKTRLRYVNKLIKCESTPHDLLLSTIKNSKRYVMKTSSSRRNFNIPALWSRVTRQHLKELDKEHKKKNHELEEHEVKCDCETTELQRMTSYNKQSAALIASLGAEIPELKLKRDRIVENAKRYVASDEEVYNNLTNACVASSNVVGRGDEEEQSVIEVLFDELVGKDHSVDDITPTGEDSDGNSAAAEWTTASSSEPWNNEGDSKPKVANLLRRQQDLNELLTSERRHYEEKLSSLKSIMEDEKEKSSVLQKSFDDLDRKHSEVVAELQRVQVMYNELLEEMGAQKTENVRLSDVARCAELETAQIKELAKVIEDERSRVKLENIELVEKVRNLENSVSTLQASESECKQHYEELTQRYESLVTSFSTEREELIQQLEVLQKTWSSRTAKNELKKQLSLLKENYDILEQQNEEKCGQLAHAKSQLSQVNEDLDSTKEELEQTAAKMAELQSSLASAQMEILSSKGENALLTTKVCECEEIIKSTEQDLEETRMAYAHQKEDNA